MKRFLDFRILLIHTITSMSENTAGRIFKSLSGLVGSLSSRPATTTPSSSGPPESLAGVVANFQSCSSISGTCEFLSRQSKHFPAGNEKAILELWNESERHAQLAQKYNAEGEEGGAKIHSLWSQVFWEAGERVKVGTLDGFTSDGMKAGTEAVSETYRSRYRMKALRRVESSIELEMCSL